MNNVFCKPAPVEGSTVFVCGHPMTVKNLRIVEWDGPSGNKPGFGKVCRFEGVCTDDSRNDMIRNTGYNGGTYGWRVE